MQNNNRSAVGPTVLLPAAYSFREKLLSASVLLGMGGTISTTAVFANGTAANFVAPPAPSAFLTQHQVNNHTSNFVAGWSSAAQSTALSGLHSGFAVSTVLHSINSVAATTATQTWKTAIPVTHALVAQTSNQDLNLGSSQTSFIAGSLAGFHQLTIDVGGKQEVVKFGTALTAAELVAAQQVLSSGSQQITINAKGIATGGTIDLTQSSVSGLDSALGGAISSLDITHGVQVIDTLSSLNLTGSLINKGTLDVGAALGSQGQNLDSITAANITNAAGGIISSTSIPGSLVATDLTLSTPGTFSNAGTISALGNLTVNAPAVTNSGTLSSANASVTLANSGNTASVFNVNNTGGTIQAANGAINLNAASYAGSGGVAVTGGNLLSQQANFNAGTGAINVNVDQLTGEVNGTASSSHVIADTANLNLGKIDVSGDPLYYNTGGNVVVDSTFTATGGQDLAIVASGNIIGNGGALDTSVTGFNSVAGNLTLIAGANFSASGQSGQSNATAIITDSTAAGKGSKTGGYIDLSGVTYTGSTTNTAVTAVNASSPDGLAGNVLMVAYKGSAANSGNVMATATSAQTMGAQSVDATGSSGTGSITIIAGGTAVQGQGLDASTVTVYGATPTLGTGNNLTIANGSVTGTAYSLSPSTSKIAPVNVNLASITSANAVITTSGIVAGGTSINASSSIDITSAGAGTSTSAVSLSGTGMLDASASAGATKGAYYFTSTGDILTGTVSYPVASTVSLISTGAILSIAGNITGGNVTLNAADGISGPGTITATTLSFIGGSGSPILATINTQNLSVNGSGVSASLEIIGAKTTGTTNILTSNLATEGSLTITSNQALNVTGAITAGEGVALGRSAGAAGTTGIDVLAPITTTSLMLTTFGADNIVVGPKAVITSANVDLDAGGSVGSKSAPILLNTAAGGSVTANAQAGSMYLSQAGAGTVNAQGTGGATQAGVITGTGAILNIGNVSAASVTIADTYKTGAIDLGSGTVGVSGSNVTVTAPGSITQDANGTVNGSFIKITSTAGDIGTSSSSIQANNTAGSSNIKDSSLTVNAAKGSVYVVDLGETNLLAGAALNTFNVSGVVLNVDGAIKGANITLAAINDQYGDSTSLTIGAAIGTAATKSVNLSATADITQTPKTSYLVTGLAQTINAGYDAGSSEYPILTKAASIDVTGSSTTSTVIKNTGDVSLSASGGYDLTITSTGAINVSAPIAYANNYVTLTAAKSVNVLSGGQIVADTLTINSPTVTVVPQSGISVTASSSFNGGAAALSITGGGTIDGGLSVSLSGKSVTLGDATGANNPLVFTATGTTLNLTVGTTGNFTIGSNIVMNSSLGNAENPTSSIYINAANIVDSNSSSIGPVQLTANPTAANPNAPVSGTVSVTLSGTQAATLGSGTGQFQLSAAGTNGASDGSVSFSTKGALTVTAGGIVFANGGGSVSLGGAKSLAINADILSSGNLSDVYLATQSSGVFTVGAGGTSVANGTIGALNANQVIVSTKSGVLVDPITGVSTISGNEVGLYGATITNNASVVGTGTTPEIVLASADVSGNANVAISTTQTGSFTGFPNLSLAAAGNGTINTGNLFTSANLFGVNGAGLQYLEIYTNGTGGITLSPMVTGLTINSGGTLYIYTDKLISPVITAGAFPITSSGGVVDIDLNTSLTAGTAKGDYNLLGSYDAIDLNAYGTLTINEALAVTGTDQTSQFTGTNVVINQNITAPAFVANAPNQGSVAVYAYGNSGTIITNNASLISAEVTLGQGFKASPSAISTQTNYLFVDNGYLTINNTITGQTSIKQITGDQLTSVNLVDNAGSLVVGSMTTVGGGVNIVENTGSLTVAEGSQVLSGGNILLQAVNASQTLSVESSVYLHGSSTKAGVGQVELVVGALPTTLNKGTAPSTAPTPTGSGGGTLYWNLSNDTNVQFFGAANSLVLDGRNIIFSPGASGTITVGQDAGDSNTGNVGITADPPAVAGANAAMFAAASPAIAANFVSQPSVAASITPNAVIAVTTPSIPVASTQNNVSLFGGISNLSTLEIQPAPGGLLHNKQKAVLSKRSIEQTKGATLLSPQVDTVVETSMGKIAVAAKSLVLILCFDGGIAVYNLHDTARNAVSITSGDRHLSVLPGRSVVLTSRSVRYFEEINPVPSVAYRNVQSQTYADGSIGFQSEFNALSLLQGIEPLRNFVRDNDPRTSRAAQSMLKTAAILSQLGSSQYQYMPNSMASSSGKTGAAN